MSKKIEIHDEVNCENGVIALFGWLFKELGFDEFMPPNARGLDIPSISYKGKEVVVEFEYKSSNFLIHGHQNVMEKQKDYVVICWQDDCGLKNKLQTEYNKLLYEVIEISKYVIVKERKKTANAPIDYYIMSYNNKSASGIEFSRWSEINIFRTNFHQTKFPDGFPENSKILISQNGLIVGGFTVVRCVKIERPKSKEAIELYKNLVNKPITFWNHEDDFFSEGNFINWHIFYNEFFDLGENKKKLTNYDLDKKVPNDGKLKVDQSIYDRIKYS